MNGRVRWLGLAAVALALAGCSSNGNDSANGSAGMDSAAVAPAAPAPAGSGPADRGSTAGQVKLEPALIRTARIDVVVDDVTSAAATAGQLAVSAQGAVAGDDRSGSDGDQARATLVLKVPPARMDGLLDQLAGLGRESSRSSTTQDVTEDVADVESRVATMKASIARVRAILARADKIGDVVAVEGELSKRTTELESLEARQRVLAAQTGYATVTVALTGPAAPIAAPPAERGGFLGGLEAGWHGFTATVGAVLVVLGAVLPFLIVLVPLGLVARWVLRRRAATAAPSAPAPPLG